MGVAASFDHIPAPCYRTGCPEDPKARRMFGCDEDADGGYSVWCPMCRGSAAGCPKCDHGRLTIKRCPNSCGGSEVSTMLNSFSHYRAGFLPIAGGVMDQASTYVDSMTFIASVVSHHEEIEMDKARGK